MLGAEDIILRKMQASDAEYLFKWENNPANWTVSETTHPFSQSDIEQFIQEPQNITYNNQLRLMIDCKDRPIGCIDLFEYNGQTQSAGVGVLIAASSDRNKGFATQALNLLKAYARNELQIVHLFCHIQSENQASLRLFEKCGFKRIDQRQLNGERVHYLAYTC